MKKSISHKPASSTQSCLEITPEANDLWKGIGGHFESLCQILCEFIDNSISNLEANNLPNRLITVTFDEVAFGIIAVSIEDNGTGISNLTAALKIGDKSIRETQLNEHGFGLKHALAHANPENSTWQIATRTQADYDGKRYKLISAPYSFSQIVKAYDNDISPWPGIYDESGTWIYFECTEVLFNTLRSGIGGKPSFDRCLDYLCEDLGFIYSGHIESKKVAINVVSSSTGYLRTVESVKPDWRTDSSKTIDKPFDLGGGVINIVIKHGTINKSKYIRYYKANQATSGAEIRFNGRAMGFGLFQEIWDLEVHNKYNSFLAVVDIRGDKRDAFPKTVTSKTRPRTDDRKIKKLFDYIRGMIPRPASDDIASEWSANELIHQLASIFRDNLDGQSAKVEESYDVYSTLKSPVTMDIYKFDGEEVCLYKAKKDIAYIRDAYDLLMYWDGLVADGGRPSRGLLVASNFSDGVVKILAYFNEMTDRSGNNYNLDVTTWRDQGVLYP